MVPTLETPRLRLRAYVPTDRAQFVATYTDPEVMVHVDGALSAESAGALFDGVYDGSRARVFGAWCVEHDGETVGHGALLREGETLGVGYILPRRSWGHGYATEIARAITQYALHTLGRARLTATVDVGNASSCRVLQKIGMTLVKRVDDPEGAYFIYEAIAAQWTPDLGR